jgi:hypothetical protein
MSKKTLVFVLAATLLTYACSPNEKTKDSGEAASVEVTKPTEADVPFTEAKNYFVRNDYIESELHSVKITNQADFDSIFGAARTMGEDGKPTPIDFSKQYVIACIAKTSDKITALAVNSLKKTDNTILLTYNQTEGEKQSFTSRRLILLIVGNEHEGEIKLQSK